MFTNLIESDSHRNEFKRRSSFFLATVAAYALVLSGAGVASIYAYDAHLEAQSTDITLLSWVPPVDRAPEVRPPNNETVRRSPPSHAPIDRNIRVQERTVAVAPVDSRIVPNFVGTKASDVPPVTGAFRIGNRNVDPPSVLPANSECVLCNTAPPVVRVPDTAPPPVLVKPPTQRVTSVVLASRAISLPQPPYPPLARQIKVSGTVSVQILVDEAGRVVSAHALGGHPFLTRSAEEAAQRARFTPTVLNGQPVKVQGVITYNFVLQ